MRKLALLLVLLFGCHHGSPTAPAQAADLDGKVTSAVTGAALPSVQVTIDEANQEVETATTPNGTYDFTSRLIAGSATITAKATGYITVSGTTTLVKGQNHYDIQMQPLP